MPTTNTRCPAARAAAISESAFQISPSVMSSTSAAASVPPSAKTDRSAASISVPPRSAVIADRCSAAVRIAAGVAAVNAATSWHTVLPKRDSVNRSAGVRPAKIRCSARLAASMLSPFIEPEQSTRTFSRSGASAWSRGTSAQKLASAT